MRIEHHVPLPTKRSEAPRKPVRHSYAIPHRMLTEKVRVLQTGESFFVKVPNHVSGVEMQRRLAGAIGGSYLKNSPITGRRYAIRQVQGGVRVWRKV